MEPVRDIDFINRAFTHSQLGTCDRARVGCVLVKDDSIIETGHNAALEGMANCNEFGHLMHEGHCIRTVHAEERALMRCAKYGTAVEGATAYVTHEPCLHCTRMLNEAGIKRVVFFNAYRGLYNHAFIGDMEWEHYSNKEMTNHVTE